MTRANNNLRLVSLMVIIIAILVALIIAEWATMSLARQTLLKEVNDVTAQAYDIEELPSIDLSKTTLADYSEMVNRPLFIEGRRPIEIDDSDEEVAIVVGDFKLSLVGIFGTAQGKGMSALFKNAIVRADEPKYYKVFVGDDVQGWRIDEIQSDKVLLSNAGSKQQANLRKPRPKKTAAPKNNKNIKAVKRSTKTQKGKQAKSRERGKKPPKSK